MTITTGKPAGRPCAALPQPAPRLLPRLLPLAAAAMLLANECHADWRIQPSVALTERYTDNAGLQSDGNKRSQFISEFNPALSVTGSGRRFKMAATGQWRHFTYFNEQQQDLRDHLLEYALSGQATLVDELLFVDASASQTPRSISAFGPQASSTPYLGGNQALIKTWRVSPRLEQRFGTVAHASLRYTRDSVQAGDFDPFGDTLGDTINASLTSGTAFKSLDWGLSYLRQDLDTERAGDTSSETAIGNLRYALTRRFALTASAGYDRYDFQALGGRTAGRNWSAGFDWTPSQRTRLSAALGRHFYGQTGKLDARHRSRHTVWSINYDDGVTTSRQQFLLPSTIDTAALLDTLFAPTISDPVLRQQAVLDYLRNTGLPSSLADSVNYLSNRYIRQRQLQAAAAYTKGRSTGIVSLFRTERVALSSQESDSPILGTQVGSLNDNVRQLGANLSYTYRITPRSNVLAAASYTRSRSLITGIEDQRRDFHIAYTRQVTRTIRGAVELRRLEGGGFGFNAGDYRENAISATLSAQL